GSIKEAAIGILENLRSDRELGLQVLAAGDKEERPLNCFAVSAISGCLESVNEERRVGKIGPRLAAIAGSAVIDVFLVFPFPFIPLLTLDVGVGFFQDLVIAAILVRFLEAQNCETRLVIGQF